MYIHDVFKRFFIILLYLLEWMAVRGLLNCLKNRFVDTENNGTAKGKK